jgi:hypothetical protein
MICIPSVNLFVLLREEAYLNLLMTVNSLHAVEKLLANKEEVCGETKQDDTGDAGVDR